LLEPDTVVIFAKSVGRAEENILVTRLDEADPSLVDMSTLVIVGARGTRVIARAAATPFVYTSRKAP
jgi:precorrin-3B C17-methyltransferase